jgi:hypothetical protein
MRLGSEMDPALQAATQALSRRAQYQASRFASIELRAAKGDAGRGNALRTGRRLVPLGYAMATTFGLALVLAAWFF